MILLTGGAGGLGRALADLILKRGGNVFLCDVDASALEKVRETLVQKHPTTNIGTSALDVRRKTDWENAWEMCENNLGKPAVVVNIAGIKGEQSWEDMYDINLVSFRHSLLNYVGPRFFTFLLQNLTTFRKEFTMESKLL